MRLCYLLREKAEMFPKYGINVRHYHRAGHVSCGNVCRLCSSGTSTLLPLRSKMPGEVICVVKLLYWRLDCVIIVTLKSFFIKVSFSSESRYNQRHNNCLFPLW